MRQYPLTYNGFKQGLVEGRLLGLKCRDCGSTTIPPNGVCTSCGGVSLEVRPFSSKGKIQTFTVIRVAPVGFDPPYIVSMVELEDGPWVVGNVVGIDPDKADMGLIGKRVSVGHRLLPHNEAEGGVEGFALTFTLLD